MCGHGNSPSPPPSDDGSYEGSDDGSDGPTKPRYTPEELGALFVDFYSFLTTLHYDRSDLKIPTPTGWPCITPESCGNYKSDYAVQVLRHLPYFDSAAYIHFKSKLLDLTAFTLEDFEKHKDYHQGWEFWSSEGELIDDSNVVCIAVGHESFSRELWLNVIDCEIFEDFHAGDMLDAVPIETFFDSLKEKYETLRLIPGQKGLLLKQKRSLNTMDGSLRRR